MWSNQSSEERSDTYHKQISNLFLRFPPILLLKLVVVYPCDLIHWQEHSVCWFQLKINLIISVIYYIVVLRCPANKRLNLLDISDNGIMPDPLIFQICDEIIQEFNRYRIGKDITIKLFQKVIYMLDDCIINSCIVCRLASGALFKNFLGKEDAPSISFACRKWLM